MYRNHGVNRWRTLALAACMSVATVPAAAQTFVSGSTGADGPLNATTNITLNVPPDGVFNFTTVNIANGVSVRFNRNALNTPVYILATGNVTLSGMFDVSGANGSSFGGGQGG